MTNELVKLVGGYILSKGGGAYERPYGYKWGLRTKYGEMLVTVHDDDEGSIFGRFQGENIAKANEGVGCNPYSGKWNFHFNKDLKAGACFEEWKRTVEGILL